jgi:hypothetical protein
MFEWAAIQVKVTYRMDSSFVTVSMIDHVNLKDNLLASKFSSITKTKKIFKSKVFEEVQKQLNSKTHGQCLVIQGLPGIGKSTACWASCCMKSCSDAQADFIFAYFYKSEVRGVIHLQGGKVIAAAYVRPNLHPTMGDILMNLRHDFPAAQLVLDGVHQHHADALVVNSSGWITVASVGLSFKGDAFDMGDKKLVKLELDSWTLEEFEKAVEQVVIDPQVLEFDKEVFGLDGEDTTKLKKEWVNERYFISGGSARLMFRGNAEEVMREIDDALLQVQNLDDLYCSFSGPKSIGDISRLRQRIEQKYTFLSPYVLRELSRLEEIKVTTLDWDTFVKSAKHVAKDMKNNAFKGWVHEFDFLVKLYPAKGLPYRELSLNLVDQSGNHLAVQLEVRRKVSFWKEDDLAGLSLKDTNVLAVPKSFKQGTYDAAFVCYLHGKTPVIITMQATVSPDTHSFKPSYITSLVNQLDYSSEAKEGRFSLWHVFVLENADQFNTFALPVCTEVGIRSTRQNQEKAWAMKPIFWKTNLNA